MSAGTGHIGYIEKDKRLTYFYSDILKMDIEFAEFESMDGLSEAFPMAQGYDLPIGQLMIEIHLFNGTTAEKYLAWYDEIFLLLAQCDFEKWLKSHCVLRWERLEARGLRPTWTEPNLLAVTMNIAGDKNPLLAEYTLLNVQDNRNVLFGSLGGDSAE